MDLQLLFLPIWLSILFSTTDVSSYNAWIRLCHKITVDLISFIVNIEDSGPRKRRAEEAAASEVKPVPQAQLPVQFPAVKRPVPDNPGGKKEHDKASDDFYFEKFRRQFRR